MRRKVFGPKFYRPPIEDLERAGGVIDRMLHEMRTAVRAETKSSLDAGLARADVLFTHDSFSTESALEQRRPGQRVVMMCHAVTPMALYAVWSWGLPEADWHTLMAFADVRAWTDWEAGVWKRADVLVLPCPEASESFITIDPQFEAVLGRAHYVLSGASAPDRTNSKSGPDLLGPRKGPVGLYLGSPEPYRGFDALMAGVQALPPDSNLTIAVAGPDPRKVPTHPAVRALGRVEDVGALLSSVDFLINVNRFSLFDLSTIEATQAGTPLMLHAVGGNRVFEQLGAGCVMLRDLEPATIADCLARTAALDAAALADLGRRSRACWEQHLTPLHMWERHVALYDEIAAGDHHP